MPPRSSAQGPSRPRGCRPVRRIRGHFHTRPVGPHPRGSVQLTVAPDRFGEVACWLPLHRRGVTVFAHPSTGDDRSDHIDHVIWFGPSEKLATAMFDQSREPTP